MIVCKCRGIDDGDYATEDELRARILQPDFYCGQCQIKYFVENLVNTSSDESVDHTADLGYN